jgi:hypothetical protein
MSDLSSRRLRLTPHNSRRLLLEGLEPRLALAIVGLGVAGDSWSDEYAIETYSYAQNWVELLRTKRGVNVGPDVNFPGPNDPGWDFFEFRRTGTAFNYAFIDTLAIELLQQGIGQDFNVLNLYDNGDVSHGVLMIGNSDFAPGGEKFTRIASSEPADNPWSDFEVQFELNTVKQFIDIAMSSWAQRPMDYLVTTIPDPTLTPLGRTLFDAAGRARVTAAVSSVNTAIRASAAKYHYPVVDLAALATTLLGTPTNPATQRTIGGNVFTVSAGTPKTHLFVEGGVLPHTVFNAYVANAIIEGFNFAYNENLPLFTEQQIVTLAGLTYGGSDTLSVNYNSLITLPPVTVYVDFGQTSSPADDFTARMSELATALQIPQIVTGAPGVVTEMTELKAAIKANMEAAFAGTKVNFSFEQFSVNAVQPSVRYEAIKVGRLSSSDPGPLTSLLGHGSFDWLNSSETTNGFIYPDLIPDLTGATKLKDLPRAEQLRYLANILSYYITQETGRGLGLSSSDAFGYPAITSANAANTGGVQLLDYMSGDPALGFDTNVFHGTPSFTFSPLAQAKLQYGHWTTNPTLATIVEAAAPHDTTATAQSLTLVNSSTASQRVGVVKGAAISVGSQVDLYRLAAVPVGAKITAQTFATGVYGAPIDTVIRILAADGVTVLASSDDTQLGNNSIGQVGDTVVDTDSLVLNYVVATAGNIFIEVTAKAGGAGNYDLLVTNTVVNLFPWHNESNPLNVDASTDTPFVNAFDAIAVINQLNTPTIMNPDFTLPAPTESVAPPPYLDVDRDGLLTAFDAILVINYLNLNPLGGPGLEFVPWDSSGGEAIDSPATSTTAAVSTSQETESGTGKNDEVFATLPQRTISGQTKSGARSTVIPLSSSRSSNPLTWLLLAPLAASKETTAIDSSADDEESTHCRALAELVLEE